MEHVNHLIRAQQVSSSSSSSYEIKCPLKIKMFPSLRKENPSISLSLLSHRLSKHFKNSCNHIQHLYFISEKQEFWRVEQSHTRSCIPRMSTMSWIQVFCSYGVSTWFLHWGCLFPHSFPGSWRHKPSSHMLWADPKLKHLVSCL